MSTINDIGIPNVGSGILQPKLKNRWRVTFTNIGGGTDAQPLSMQAITVSRPNISWEEVQLDRYNSRAYIAAKHTWSEMNLSVEDDITSEAARVIQEQMQKQQYLTGIEGPWLATAPEASVYKFTIVLEMLDGNEGILERWDVEGCWFKTVDYTELDYATGDKVTINLVVRYDHARQSFPSKYTGAGLATGT